MPAETDLYPPIKRFLEGQGYTVKGETGHVMWWPFVGMRGLSSWSSRTG